MWKGSVACEFEPEGPPPATASARDALPRSAAAPAVHVDRAILKLSRGGADATVLREFDLDAKRFVTAAEGGFVVQEAKSQICYKSRDVVLVGSDFGGRRAPRASPPSTEPLQAPAR